MHGRNDLVDLDNSNGPAETRLRAPKRESTLVVLDGADGDVPPGTDGRRSATASGVLSERGHDNAANSRNVRVVRSVVRSVGPDAALTGDDTPLLYSPDDAVRSLTILVAIVFAAITVAALALFSPPASTVFP